MASKDLSLRQLLLFVACLMAPLVAQSQVSINTSGATPDASAILDVSSSGKGLLIPRMTTDQRTGISTPADGLIVYDNSTQSIWYFHTGTWHELPVNPVTVLSDADADTKIQVEENADEDLIRFDLAGSERFVFYPSRIQMPGSSNTSIGNSAGSSLLGGSYSNTALGSEAMKAMTTGNSNVAVGNTALQQSTTGSNNTAIGNNALQNANSNGNTAVGHAAMQSTTTGNNSSAFGANALSSCITGVNNTALGNASLSKLQSGNWNVAVGTGSLFYLNGSSGNAAVGHNANAALVTGNYNSSLGMRAMAEATEYSYGVAIGYGAGAQISAGENSVLLGAGAGGNVDTTSIGNVFLGYRAGYNEPGSNLLYIENSSSASPLIWGDFANDSVKIFGTLGIGNAYAFPNADGDTGFALTTNGDGSTGWTDLSPYAVTDTLSLIRDADSDTKIQVEESADEDLIRFDLGGAEKYVFYPKRIHFVDTVNTMIGGDAGAAITFGRANTSLGNNAMRSMKNGSYNVAVGEGAMEFTTGISGSVAVGFQALQYSNASGNTAIGRGALQLTTSGVSNTAVGDAALDSNTSGVNNTAVGVQALSSSTTSNLNTAFGTAALYSLISGNENTAVGLDANRFLQTGAYNSTLGLKAMEKATEYTAGVAIGHGAGSKITSGQNSVLIGAGAGGNVDTTSTGNVFIGYRAGYNEPGSDLLYIENSSSSTPLIWGDFANDAVAVNGTLSVAGNLNTNSQWISGDGDAEGIVVTHEGRVGIGNPTPLNGFFEVSGIGDVVDLDMWGYYAFDGYAINQPPTQSAYAIYTDGIIGGALFHAHSDERIKHIIGLSDSRKDLATLMQIEITDYTLIDTVLKQEGPQKKVIAQQVLDVYPQAVDTNTIEVVPDIYQMATVENGWINIHTNLMAGETIQLITDAGQELFTVETAEDSRFRVLNQERLDRVCSRGRVFVYGRQVNNFHTVDYEAIAMLNVSATQELVHRNAELEQQVATLSTTVEDFKAELHEMQKLRAQVQALLGSQSAVFAQKQ